MCLCQRFHYVGMTLCGWMFEFWGNEKMLHNGDEYLRLDYISYLSCVVGSGYPYTELQDRYTGELVDGYKIRWDKFCEGQGYLDENGKRVDLDCEHIWFDFKSQLIKNLIQYGCKCDLCIDSFNKVSYPVLEHNIFSE